VSCFCFQSSFQGGVDEDEEPRMAAFRELKEETGVTSVQLIGEVPYNILCRAHALDCYICLLNINLNIKSFEFVSWKMTQHRHPTG
jgi:8-oxo-dGTP pyrophosphatase MutT (NUDIX family)